MYKGKRDPEVEILVPQDNCFEYKSKSGEPFVEILVPPESIKNYNQQWGSIMVRPEQVYYVENSNLNMIAVNNYANILNSVKDENHISTISETLQPYDIIGRYLKYYHWCMYKNVPEQKSLNFFHNWKQSGFTLAAYMQHIPAII